MYKRYEAETLKAAVLKVKMDLGPDARILSQRQVRQSGLRGIMGKKVWQVIAMRGTFEDEKPQIPARPPAAKPPPVSPSLTPAPPPDRSAASFVSRQKIQQPVNHLIDEPALPFSELPPSEKSPSSPFAPPRKPSNPGRPVERSDSGQSLERTALRILVKEVRALSEKLNAPKPASEHVILPGALPALYQRLLAQDLPRELAVDLMSRLCDRPTLDLNDESKTIEALEDLLAEQIPTIQPDDLFSSRRPKILFVVGPSGVGKTTTLAKIAMMSARDEKLKIALITLDTFRIAAAEQLKTYADLLPADIEVVLSEDEFTSAVSRHADKDMILVDTPGRNPCSPAALSDMGDYLKRLSQLKLSSPAVLLVLSATTKLTDLDRYASCYRSLDPAAVVFTKLDETSTFGSLVSVLQTSRLPLSFVTCGQDMPEDIEPANGMRLARRILGRLN